MLTMKLSTMPMIAAVGEFIMDRVIDERSTAMHNNLCSTEDGFPFWQYWPPTRLVLRRQRRMPRAPLDNTSAETTAETEEDRLAPLQSKLHHHLSL